MPVAPRRAILLSAEDQAVVGRLVAWIADTTDEAHVFDATVRLVASVVGSSLVKILEYRSGSAELLVRAGVGWQAGIVGIATVPASSASQAGFTLRNGEMIVVDDVARTRRFTDAGILRAHGAVSGFSVPLQIDGATIGVLSVHDTKRRHYSTAELNLASEIATVVGLRLSELRRNGV